MYILYIVFQLPIPNHQCYLKFILYCENFLKEVLGAVNEIDLWREKDPEDGSSISPESQRQYKHKISYNTLLKEISNYYNSTSRAVH